MNKIFIIILSEEYNTEIMRDRIKSIGPSYVFWDNHWLVTSELSAKDIYHKLSADTYEKASIFISELNVSSLSHYYGRMNTDLWDWIQENKNQS